MNLTSFHNHSQLYFNFSLTNQLELRPRENALLSLLENLDFSAFESEKDAAGRPFALDAYTMMVIILYARMEGKYSCRDIAQLCGRDIFLMSVLDGRTAPSYVTVNRFIKQNAKAIEDLSSQIVIRLDSFGEISKDIVFQDGTKIESRAGKYSFVWKSGVEKNLEKLKLKTVDFIGEISYEMGFEVTCDEKDDFENKLRIVLALLKNQKGSLVPEARGKGHRLTSLQRYYETASSYLEKFAEYHDNLKLIGKGRNSMSKTDHDATFMRMKEDHMGNGQLKPAYNIQTLVDGNYIVGSYVSDDRTDINTMIPAMEKLNASYTWKYNGYCADSGYDSLPNHTALERMEITDYIKPQTYEISKKREYKNDIGRKENMKYDEKTDTYTCANGKKLYVVRTKNRTDGYGNKAVVKVFRCRKGCISCPLKEKCIGKSKRRFKQFETNYQMEAYRKKAYNNLTTDIGAEVRVNRSIQAEGVFAQIKANWQFRRFLSFGKQRTFSEWLLMSMAINIIHYASRISRNQTGTPFWYSIPPDEGNTAV